MYLGAAEGEAMAMIHLFGIKYATEISGCGESVPKIVRRSHVPNPHATEVYKGVKLSRYVSVRPDRDFG